MLPDDPKAPWPPKDQEPIQRDIEESAAWYSADPSRLENFYGGTESSATSRAWVRFWSRRANDPSGSARQRLHVPAAGDIAATSADLLFGDEVRIVIPEAHTEPSNGETATGGSTPAKATEDRLVELIELDGIHAKLLEGAEIAAALGGVYLRPVWDHDVAKHPMLTAVHPDNAVPEFRWGQLVAVTFWRAVAGDRNHVWRHLERHEPGRVLHGLYEGGKDTLGVRVPLDSNPATADLDVNEEGELNMPDALRARGLLVRHVPNVLPNRKHRGKPIGRSDFQGSEGLMDALDETFTDWMRDIRMGKRRVIVPDQFLERKGRGKGAQFDVDQEIFSPMDIDPGHMEKAGITLVDFDIRTQAHADTMMAIFERIVAGAGYSPASFGLKTSSTPDRTATEVRADDSRSLRTRSRKSRYWLPAIEDELEIMLIIDREIFGSKVEPMRPQVELAEQGDDPKVRAETLELFTRAQAMSIETRVRMAQPHLDGPQVSEEVARIQAETGMAVVDPTGGFPE